MSQAAPSPFVTLPKPRIVNNVLYGADADVANIVMAKIGGGAVIRRGFDNPVAALGVVHDQRVVGGIVFHTYRPGIDIEISIWMEHAGWARKSTIAQLYRYPFIQLKLPRITAITSRRNKRTRRFLKGMGWKEEGVIRKAYDGEADAIVYGQLYEECRWLKYLENPDHGQRSTSTA